MSHADELSMDNNVHHHVKQEVATPIGVEDAGDTTADESSALPRHGSRAEPSPRQPAKRKRDSSISNVPKSHPRSTPPNHVLWTRAFQKISSSALGTVSGHKRASIFGAPIKERDAPGYKHLILRPQDLKSIRSAINAGHRAATAAAPDDLNASQSSVWLPISEDLVPPKGIINNAQLEKELMRMFANAIMFNPDPKRGFGGRWQSMGKGRGEGVGFEIDEDGIVKDTKAMFSDVEKVISSLRSAERRSEEIREASASAAANNAEEEVDELAGEGEENMGSVAKRRRNV
jgi:Bromodomain